MFLTTYICTNNLFLLRNSESLFFRWVGKAGRLMLGSTDRESDGRWFFVCPQNREWYSLVAARLTSLRNDPHAHSSECQDMNCDSLSGLTNAHSASVLGNRAVGVNVLQYVYWKGSETGVSKFRMYGAALQKRARRVCITAAGSFQQCSSLRTGFFWSITQREVVLSYRRFGTTYPIFMDSWILEPWTWDR